MKGKNSYLYVDFEGPNDALFPIGATGGEANEGE